jgi:DNA-nicking Smr family endonuclease
VAKLSDLRSLLDAARDARDETTSVRRPVAARASGVVRNGAPSATPRTAHPASSERFMNGHARETNGRRHVAATKHADGDIDISKAFADVTRLPHRNRAPSTKPRPTSIPRLRIEDERAALELSKYGAEPSPRAWDIGLEIEGEQTFLRPGLRSDILVKLRRGHWVVQSVIDLHGMIVDEAHDALGDFLLDARGKGLRCVRIIHGKGLTSKNREPVLKGKVRRWLAQWDDVLAYCEAPPHAGGSGAVVALLRGR